MLRPARYSAASTPIACDGGSSQCTRETLSSRSGDGDLEGASAAAEQWLRSAPADVAMLILAGKLRARRSDWEAAIPLLERAARIDPGNAEARAALTEARRRR